MLCVHAEVEFSSLLRALDVADVQTGVGEPHQRGFSSCLEVSDVERRTTSVEGAD